jgi:membrane-associated phospholipid phosphatase
VEGHAFTAEALPRRRVGVRRPGAWGPLAVAGACVAAAVLLYLISSRVPAAQWRDATVLYHLNLLDRPGVDSTGLFLLHLLEPALFVCWASALVFVALARGRPRLALAAAAVTLLAPYTAERLKPLLAHPHDQVGGVRIGPASWPSGHSTAALALVLAAVLVAPARLRPLVAAAGAAFAGVVGVLLLVLAWHMPSDVLGGYLVAAVWGALAVAALRVSERLRPSPAA